MFHAWHLQGRSVPHVVVAPRHIYMCMNANLGMEYLLQVWAKRPFLQTEFCFMWEMCLNAIIIFVQGVGSM